ncbi:lipase member H-B-like [Bacillus rossius redtenbacheri]|uniref:lipase member H-B-like n=1 Tax=Bacillus rossius redtenbacheri TaxID=93214 RepID=UPI002FDCF58A
MKSAIYFLVCGVFVTLATSYNLYDKSLVKEDGNNNQSIATRFDAEKDVLFLLYTQKNPLNPEYISVGDAASLGNFNVKNSLKLVIHGWIANSNFLDAIREAYIASGEDCNIVMVDWSKGSEDLLYNEARDRAVSVGERTAALLEFLVSKGLGLSNIHLVGHSLGAHAAGVAGNRMKSGKVGRITGLDPAAPLYSAESVTDRLDSTDAAYVDVIHTCGGVLGWADPLGHSDFYPNGGTMVQPGCNTNVAELGLGSCSHNRCPALFAESITTKKGFVGVKCSNWLLYQTGMCSMNDKELMGDKTSTSARGTYYLKTASSSPFAEG